MGCCQEQVAAPVGFHQIRYRGGSSSWREEWIRDREGLAPSAPSLLAADTSPLSRSAATSPSFRSLSAEPAAPRQAPPWRPSGPSHELDLRHETILEKGTVRRCGRKWGRQRRSSVEAATSEESSTARSGRRPPQLRMDSNQSNDGSQGDFPGGNMFPYQGAWNPYMYPPLWFQQGLPPPASNVSVMHPVTNDPEVVQLPGNTDVSMTDSPTVSGKVKRSKVAGRTKLGNFNPAEDTNLVKSWLEICCDPITSTRQKRDRMWDRILQRYNTRRGSYPERSVRSLQSCWNNIKAEMGKFSSFYADVIRENPSGMSDADKTTHAAAIFAGVLKHNFAYMHCWEIMKDEPKWQDPKTRASAKQATGRTPSTLVMTIVAQQQRLRRGLLAGIQLKQPRRKQILLRVHHHHQSMLP